MGREASSLEEHHTITRSLLLKKKIDLMRCKPPMGLGAYENITQHNSEYSDIGYVVPQSWSSVVGNTMGCQNVLPAQQHASPGDTA